MYVNVFTNGRKEQNKLWLILCQTQVKVEVVRLVRFILDKLKISWSSSRLSKVVTTPTTIQRNTTSTQWVGWTRKRLCKPHPPPHPTTQTQQQPLWASEQHSLMTTKYSVINNNKQDHHHHHHNNNNDNNNINNKIISFRSLRLTFIDHN